MKIHIAKYEPGRIGGGWSFQDNLASGIENHSYEDADIYFISSPSMLQRDEVFKAKEDGKKIVLRLDNAVRNSRNRNTGMTRMRDFAVLADLIIYQSHWAKDYLIEFTGMDGIVILNGTDIEAFRPNPNGYQREVERILYSRFNRDETKNYEVARYWFSRYAHKNPGSMLMIVGQFSDELREGHFDFYNNERFQYLGVLAKKEMADLYRMCNKFLYTYYNDACSNTLIEALVSGCEIVGDKYYRRSGGAAEIMSVFESAGSLDKARRFFSRERMCIEYTEAMSKL